MGGNFLTMIKANESRIGNYFKYGNGNFKVEYISSVLYFRLDNVRNAISFVEIEPTLLTKEILEKCGFVHTASIYYKHVSEQWLAKVYDDKSVRISFMRFPSENFICGIYKYLHQLQNLYFALTGDELEINL